MVKALIIATFALLHSGLAMAATPSTASLKELFAVTEARKTVDSMLGQSDTMLQNMINQISSSQGKPLSAKQKAVVERYGQKFKALYAAELRWEKMETVYLDLYAKTFSQDEVDGMVQFYKSKAGQAVVKKMPALTQNMMAVMQEMMMKMMPKVTQLAGEMAAEVTKAGGK